jgi:phospholipase/carboxylesterase
MALSGPSRPAANGTPDSLIVFIHGFGADGNDLIGLAGPMSAALPGTAFISPDGPESCPGAGRQWFAIPELNQRVLHQGVLNAAPVLEAFIADELARRNLTADRLALVGFSQGTMLALHLGLGTLKPKAIVGFSGLLTGPVGRAGDLPPVLLVHGDSDPLIPLQAMLMTADVLAQAGVAVERHVSPNTGHGIDDGGLARATAFLQQALATGG